MADDKVVVKVVKEEVVVMEMEDVASFAKLSSSAVVYMEWAFWACLCFSFIEWFTWEEMRKKNKKFKIKIK